MFFQSRKQTLDVIAKLQHMACAYSLLYETGANVNIKCDCKYGGTNLMKGTETGNGCPELRSVAEILAVMTDFEWKRLVKRVGTRDMKKLRAQMKKAAVKSKRARRG